MTRNTFNSSYFKINLVVSELFLEFRGIVKILRFKNSTENYGISPTFEIKIFILKLLRIRINYLLV